MSTWDVVALTNVSSTGGAEGLCFDSQGRVYASGRSIDNAGIISRLNPDGSGQIILNSGSAMPQGIVMALDGTILIADSGTGSNGHGLVRRMSADGSTLETLNSDTPGPQGIATDSDGNVWVTDYFDSAIRKMASDGSNLTVVASTMNAPLGIVVDTDGTILISDQKIVKRMNPDGTGITALSTRTGTNAYSYGIAIDSMRRILTADYAGDVTRMNSDGSGLVTLFHIDESLTALAIDSSSRIWVGTVNGNLYRATEMQMTYGKKTAAMMSMH